MAQILLVDDEKVARALYTDFLTGAGHEVTPVGSATEALEALSKQSIDILVTDLILPESDGLDLMRSVRTLKPGIAVIVITALDKVEPAVRAIKSGAADYLVKPVSPSVLAHSVARALAQSSLLKENESLRRNVALLEAGQRIATTLDRDRLVDAAGASFGSMCGAGAVAVFVREAGVLTAMGVSGPVAEQRDAVLRALADEVADAAKGLDRHGQALSVSLPSPYETAFLVPAYEGDVLLGAVALLYAGDISDEGVALAPYLVRHLALGLKNLGKFSEVEDLAYLDDLTHLFNSRYLELVLEKQFKETTSSDKPFTLLFTDLDYFKSINDSHGHVVGSKLLVEVARVLKGCVRDNDVVCRWGGDEYVILLRGTDSGGALKVAERIRRSIEGHRFLAREGFGLNITTCIGIASYPEHATDKASLLDFADRAMYRGKKGARNITYMAAKGLEATPADRHQPYTPPGSTT